MKKEKYKALLYILKYSFLSNYFHYLIDLIPKISLMLSLFVFCPILQWAKAKFQINQSGQK